MADVEVLTWVNRRQERVTVSPGGVQPSLKAYHIFPWSQVASSTRASPVFTRTLVPGWTPPGGGRIIGKIERDTMLTDTVPGGTPVREKISTLLTLDPEPVLTMNSVAIELKE
jgi:hypothetical protein